jgi:hypothetical protein
LLVTVAGVILFRVLPVLVVGATLAVDVLTGAPSWLLLLQGFVLAFVAALGGYTAGMSAANTAYRRAFDEAFVACVGGPMDGVRLPSPPGVHLTVAVSDHPEGEYMLDGDLLFWTEH